MRPAKQMNLNYEIGAKGSGIIPDISPMALGEWISDLATDDFLILENHELSWVQVRCETEGEYRLEFLNDLDRLIYATEPELVGRDSVCHAFLAFASGMTNLRELPEAIRPAWVVGSYQLEPTEPLRKLDPVRNEVATTGAQHSNGYEFEEYVATVLNKAGWTTRLTKKSGDQGLDVLAFDDRYRVALQCKRYASPVGNSAVQEAHAAADFIGASHAVLVATSGFTASAIQLGEVLGVVLLGEENLAEIRTHLVFVSARPTRITTANIFR